MLTAVDWLTIGAYFAVTFAIGFYFARQERSSSEYFLGGRSIPWPAIAGSLFVSNISSEHLIGLAGSGAASGLAVGNFEWLACLILLLLGWVFVPFYMSTKVSTMPEFLELRYSRFCRDYLTGVTIAAYIFTKISVSLYAGALVLEKIMGWPMWLSSLVLILATGAYTIAGGLKAVIYTDTVQTVILIAGSILLTWLGLSEVGGWAELTARTPGHYFDMVKPASDREFPWTGIFLGAPILGVWYWCTDQVIVQKALSAKDTAEAKKGVLLTAYLKILPVFILVLPGVIALALYPDVFARSASGAVTNGDIAYPLLIERLMPAGLKGVMIAAMLAALMGHLSSTFNSSSTLITFDVYKRFYPDASEKRLVAVGRLSTAALVGLSLLWLPFMKYISSQMYIYLQAVQAYVSPPIAAVFLIGVAWSGASAAGAAASLLTGLAIGGLRFVLEVWHGISPLASPLALSFVKIHFLHFALYLFVLCSAVLAGVSWLYPSSGSRLPSLDVLRAGGGKASDRAADFWAIVLLVLMAVLWARFS